MADMRGFINRLRALEELHRTQQPLSFDAFCQKWETLTAMDRACYEAMALGGNCVIREYLERLGVIDPAEPSLQEIARQMEENYGL